METLLPDLNVIVLGSMLGNDVSGLLLNLFVGQRKRVLRKEFFKLVHGVVCLSDYSFPIIV